MIPLTVANPNVTPERYNPSWFRFLEILPGACVWIALLAPFLLSISWPLTVTLFIIVFDVYWLTQTFNYSLMLILGYRRLKKNLAVDWSAKLKRLEKLSEQERQENDILDPSSLYHAVILANYKENESIVEASLRSLTEADFPSERMIVVLAIEGREGEEARERGKAIAAKYKNAFFRFLVTEHPDNIPGEIRAKGANVTWAAKRMVEMVRKETTLPLDHIIVSTADVDSRFDRRYFSCLAYAYAILPDRERCGYQPISTYFNNIWEAPAVSRLLAFGTTFWQLIESVRDYRLITFSTHAMSLQTLVDIDYWCTSIVNEDSRQFFRAFFHYHGKFRVVPLFMPTYMDAVQTRTLLGTMKNLYRQQQRWAYGAEHFPYIVLESWRQHDIPRLDRFMLVWRAFQGAFSWATSSFFITFVGWIPILLNVSFRDQVVVSNFITVTNGLLSLTWIGLIISSVLTIKILSISYTGKRSIDIFSMLVQWLLVPFTGLIFGALPGLDAITHLMLGRYIGFRVTEKVRLAPKKA